jgi:hypothetical protein
MYFLLMALILAIGSFAQTNVNVPIGTGTTTSMYVPTYIYYNYSLTEAIYDADEITISGDITSLSYYSLGSQSRTVAVYMAEYNQSSFSSYSNYIPDSAFHLVYTGSISWTSGWNTITLDSSFNYTHTNNLVIAFQDNSGSWTSNVGCQGTTMSSNKCIYFYHDNSQITIASPSAGNENTYNVRPNIRLGMSTTDSYCSAPMNLTSSLLTATGATLTWNGVDGATSYNVQYKLQSDTSWASATTVAVTDTTYALTGLNSNTYYEARVQNNCGTSQSTYSNIVSFATLNSALNAVLPYTCDFEDSTENAAWTFVQLGETNKWYIGSDTANSVNNTENGAKGLYVSNNNGLTYAYSLAPSYSQNAICYAYRDIDVPAGATQLALSFDWKAMGYSATEDFLRFYVVNADSTTITAGQVLTVMDLMLLLK